MAVNERDRHEWLYHPVTQEFLEDMRQVKQKTMEAWAKQAYSTPETNAAAIGRTEQLQDLIDTIEGFRDQTQEGEMG